MFLLYATTHWLVNVDTALTHVTLIFNEIAIQDKGPGGKWTRKPLAYLCVTCSSEIFVNFVFKHINAAGINTL